MIHKVKLVNFFSFRDEEIIFDPYINLFLGVNGAGKSNMLKALKLLKAGMEGMASFKEMMVNQWGGFDNIFWKGSGEITHRNSIGLDFWFLPDGLNNYGPHPFRDLLKYEIRIIQKAGSDNYYLSEKVISENNFVYLNIINGAGTVSERIDNNRPQTVRYNDFDPQELSISQISEFDSNRFLPLVQLKRAIRDISFYNYFDTSPSSALRKPVVATSNQEKLLPDGSNLAQIINHIKIKEKRNFGKLLEGLRSVNVHFNDIDFNFLGSGVFEMLLEEKGLNSAVHIAHISDGTLRFLCLLAILVNPKRGRLVCIDEPEVGLHPDMVHGIVTLIKEFSPETTFWIATHSEAVVNHFEIEHVRIFEKGEDNATVVKTYKATDFEGWYDQFFPGTMWRSGDLGGNRY